EADRAAPSAHLVTKSNRSRQRLSSTWTACASLSSDSRGVPGGLAAEIGSRASSSLLSIRRRDGVNYDASLAARDPPDLRVRGGLLGSHDGNRLEWSDNDAGSKRWRTDCRRWNAAGCGFPGALQLAVPYMRVACDVAGELTDRVAARDRNEGRRDRLHS